MTEVRVLTGAWSTPEAVAVGPLLFLSGTTAKRVDGGYDAAASVEAQVEVVLDRVAARLAVAGARLDDVVKLTVYLRDIADLPIVDRAYRRRFGDRRPARTTIQTGGFEDGAWLELDVVAVEPTATWTIVRPDQAPPA